MKIIDLLKEYLLTILSIVMIIEVLVFSLYIKTPPIFLILIVFGCICLIVMDRLIKPKKK